MNSFVRALMFIYSVVIAVISVVFLYGLFDDGEARTEDCHRRATAHCWQCRQYSRDLDGNRGNTNGSFEHQEDTERQDHRVNSKG